MNKDSLWLGFFEAGEKSSPIAHDPKLNTGNPATVYLFNLNRNKIIEYKREIAEAKLRNLNKDEADIAKELKKAFNKAVKEFTPRGKNNTIAESKPMKAETSPKHKENDPLDIDIDDDDDIFDDDMDDED